MINNVEKSQRSKLMEKIRWIAGDGFDETFESVIVKDFKTFKPVSINYYREESTQIFGISKRDYDDSLNSSSNFIDLVKKLILEPFSCGIYSNQIVIQLFLDKDSFEVTLNNASYSKGIDDPIQFKSKLKIGEVEISSLFFKAILRKDENNLLELKKSLMSELKSSVEKRYLELLEFQQIGFANNESILEYIEEHKYLDKNQDTNWDLYNRFDFENIKQKKEMSLFFYEDNLIKNSESFQKIAKSLSEGFSKEERIHLLELLKEEIC
jgi:hypothetical protein